MNKELFVDCDICGMYHPASFLGDCREDEYRFDTPEEAEKKELELIYQPSKYQKNYKTGLNVKDIVEKHLPFPVTNILKDIPNLDVPVALIHTSSCKTEVEVGKESIFYMHFQSLFRTIEIFMDKHSFNDFTITVGTLFALLHEIGHSIDQRIKKDPFVAHDRKILPDLEIEAWLYARNFIRDEYLDRFDDFAEACLLSHTVQLHLSKNLNVVYMNLVGKKAKHANIIRRKMIIF